MSADAELRLDPYPAFQALRKSARPRGSNQGIVLFDIWVTESMGWLIYFFSFPGILVGALLAIFFTPSRKAFEASIAFGWVASGIALNLAVFAIGLF
ncbi:hypothetical protein LRS56_10790 [Pseudomonas poae]|nr:hypothetical protein LRS56_10790 [Pseudomonas poae]